MQPSSKVSRPLDLFPLRFAIAPMGHDQTDTAGTPAGRTVRRYDHPPAMVDSSSTRPEPEAAGRPESTDLPAGGAPLVVIRRVWGHDHVGSAVAGAVPTPRAAGGCDLVGFVGGALVAIVGLRGHDSPHQQPADAVLVESKPMAAGRMAANPGGGPVYVCEHDAKTYRLLGLGRVAKKWICPLPALPRRPEEHVVEHLLRFARQTPAALGGETLAHLTGPPPDHRLEPTAAAREDCAAWLAALGLGRAGEPMVLIHPGNKKTMRRGHPRRARNIKYWPAENWAAVIRGVRSALPASRVLVSGTARERPLAASIVQACADPQVVNLAGQLSIPRLLALQVRAHSMISVDTGPSHAATAVGCPVVVLIVGNALASCGPRPTSAPAQVVVSPVSPATGDSARSPPSRRRRCWRLGGACPGCRVGKIKEPFGLGFASASRHRKVRAGAGRREG